jgi:two-component system, chemotaxis family, CheB/CheR fusion protein
LRRIERRLQGCALPGLTDYRGFLRTNPEEVPLLLQDLLISLTNFFGDA